MIKASTPYAKVVLGDISYFCRGLLALKMASRVKITPTPAMKMAGICLGELNPDK
jgi:hypothetical protein